MEPSKHQYDFDVETVAGFLRHYGLERDFRMNIWGNRACVRRDTGGDDHRNGPVHWNGKLVAGG